MRRTTTPTLTRDGYMACDRVNLPDAMRVKLHQLCIANRNGLSYNSERRGMIFDSSMFAAHQWACAFPPECMHHIEAYLGRNAVLLRTEVISVPAQSKRQHIHRDHPLGPRVSLCVAMSIEPHTDVGTLLIPGSHTDGSQLPSGGMVPSATTYLIYDTHTFHAGCGNRTDTPNNNRLFVTFGSSTMTHKQECAFSRATGTMTHNPVTLRSLIAPPPTSPRRR